MMKKLTVMILALALAVSFLVPVGAEGKTEATFLYVAENGSDAASGSIDAPFATIEKAVDAARGIDGTVVINIRGGRYGFENTLNLTEKDNDLVIRAYGDEKVTISTASEIKYSDFEKVTDEAVLSRIVDEGARGKIVAADLEKLGIPDAESATIFGGNIGNSTEVPAAITYNERYLTLAQYPNGDKYTSVVSYENSGDASKADDRGLMEISYKIKDARTKYWAEAKDMWALGWYAHDWADNTTPASVDAKTGVITAKTLAAFATKTDSRVRFMNLLEEIDVPGEYYVDREARKLYMMAPEGFKEGDSLYYTATDRDFININNCSNVTLQGLKFAGIKGYVINSKENCRNIVVDDCELTGIAGFAAIRFEDAMDCRIENTYIHDVSARAIILNGGDKETLTRSNNTVKNCHIERFSRWGHAYMAGIYFKGVGNIASHNEINDSPHEAIEYHGLYNIIEYNNIYRVCTDSSDCGAIYTYDGLIDRNNEIRYNYFHDLEMIDTNKGMEMQAVYLDNMHSNTFVYGNVFYKCDSVALIGGGRDNTFVHNVMLECKKPLVIDARGDGWMNFREGIWQYQLIIDSPWKTELWQKTFPELAEILDNNPRYPMNNIIKGNIIYSTPDISAADLALKYSDIEDSYTVTKSDFADYGNQNFALKENSKVFTEIPDFEQIPMSEIGRYDYAREDKWTEKGGAPAPSDDTIKVVLDGKKIDFDVEPAIINDRTMVPLRAIFEALGAEVDWDDASKTVTAVKDGITIKMQIGNAVMTKNGETVTLDSMPTIIESRTLVPVRAIAESFGNDVGWDGATKTVSIAG